MIKINPNSKELKELQEIRKKEDEFYSTLFDIASRIRDEKEEAMMELEKEIGKDYGNQKYLELESDFILFNDVEWCCERREEIIKKLDSVISVWLENVLTDYLWLFEETINEYYENEKYLSELVKENEELETIWNEIREKIYV